MISSSLKQSGLAFNGLELFRPKTSSPSTKTLVLPPLPSFRSNRRISVVSFSKPLFVSKIESFGCREGFCLSPDGVGELEKRDLIACKAYEADKSSPLDAAAPGPTEAARKLKIGIYFATWWTLNVIFNIYNKKVLNAYPFPWLTSTLSLAAGSVIMLISWALRIAETPQTDLDFWKALFPVSSFI